MIVVGQGIQGGEETSPRGTSACTHFNYELFGQWFRQLTGVTPKAYQKQKYVE